MSAPVPDFSNAAFVIGSEIAPDHFPVRKERRLFDRGPHLASLIHKRGEDVLDWAIDLTRWLEPGETVTGARAACLPRDLKVVQVEFAPTGLVLWLADGNDGVRHEVQAYVTTSRGKRKLVRFYVITRSSIVFGTGLLIRLLVEDLVVTLPGSGTPEGPDVGPVVSFSLLQVVFPNLPVGSQSNMTVTLTNTGDTDLIITGITVAGDFALVSAS
jgi:hypothetical protein